MAEIHVLIFKLLLFSSMVHCFQIYMLNFENNSRVKWETYLVNGKETLKNSSGEKTYKVPDGVTKVIVYIVNKTRYGDISSDGMLEDRKCIADVLAQYNYRLIMLGITKTNFHSNFDLVAEWMAKCIISEPDSENFVVQTIGEDIYNQQYRFNGQIFPKYREEEQIFDCGLQKRLQDFPEKDLRRIIMTFDDLMNDEKEIRIYDYTGKVREYREIMRLPITMENGTYVPQMDLITRNYNYLKRHGSHEIHFVIVDGQTFFDIVVEGLESPNTPYIKNAIERLYVEDSTAILFVGCFNINWSEANIVAQVIVRHSGVDDPYAHIFSFGVGMFHTAFKDSKVITPSDNQRVFDIVIELIGVKEIEPISLEIYDLNRNVVSSGHLMLHRTEIPIVTVNGFYEGSLNRCNYSYSAHYPGKSFAFIVVESTNDVIEYASYLPEFKNCLKRLAAKGLMVFVINTRNFKWYDIHIISEVVGQHGTNNPKNTLIIGSSIFNTIYEFHGNKFRTFSAIPDPQSICDLKFIKNALFVDTSVKIISFCNIQSNNFSILKSRLITINGIYAPDRSTPPIIIGSVDEKNVLLIIVEQELFDFITTNVGALNELRYNVQNLYPINRWNIYLVGILNFDSDGRDNHLLGEFLRAHSVDQRSLSSFIHTFTYYNVATIWSYNNNMPMVRVFSDIKHRLILSVLKKGSMLAKSIYNFMQ